MLDLVINGQLLQLKKGTTIALKINNPIFDNEVIKGSYSLTFSIPLSDENRVILNFPDVIDNLADVQREFDGYILSEGESIRGVLKLRSIAGNMISANMQIGITALGKILKKKSIREFNYGGTRALGNDTVNVLTHMKATVVNPEQFDYVFAPYQNDDALGQKEPPEEGPAPTLTINNYGFDDYYNQIGFLDNIYNNSLTPPYVLRSAISPLPYLRYVVETIFTELGVRIQGNFFDAELSKLVIVSNSFLVRYVKKGLLRSGFTMLDVFSKQFKIGDILPDITVIDFLKKIASTFGLSIQVSLNNKLFIDKYIDITKDTDYTDWTDKASPNIEQEITDPEGFTLKYHIDSNDKLSSERVKEIDPAKLKAPVATVQGLPVYPEQELEEVTIEPDEIRYVTSLNHFYVFKIDKNAWEFYSENFPEVKIGSGEEEITQGIAMMLEGVVPSAMKPITNIKLPKIKMEGYSRVAGLFTKPEDLRLAFYRGMQPDSAGNLYPFIAEDNLNLAGAQVGNYSLRIDGEQGTYKKFWKDWLEFRRNKKIIRMPVGLSMLDLANLNMNRKVNIAGNRYLVKSIDVTLPITKPAQVELWKCKI